MTLRIENLSVNFGAMSACANISVEVKPGSVTTVVGANGAGKSTLLRSCAGLERPASGRILIDDLEIQDLSPDERVRAGLAFVPEGRATIPELTIEENLQLGGFTKPRAMSRQRAADLLQMFPALADRRTQRADVLSGGERQQLAIARALMPEPRVLLLDEPSLGLAPMIVTQILELISELARETGIRVLLVEQNAVKALRVADYAYVLSLGEVVAEGPAAELAGDARLLHAYLGVA
jgi:branched-chain amino acid transport system ATP-binding protein